MSVNVSFTVNGLAVGVINHGDGSAGDILTSANVSIKHDGYNALTNCKLYVAPYRANYFGDKTAEKDMEELLQWGDATSSGLFGGLWAVFSGITPTYLTKSGLNYGVFRHGVGDKFDNGIILPSAYITSTPAMGNDGTVPASCTVWPSFDLVVGIPASGLSIGKRVLDLRMSYTFTS